MRIGYVDILAGSIKYVAEYSGQIQGVGGKKGWVAIDTDAVKVVVDVANRKIYELDIDRLGIDGKRCVDVCGGKVLCIDNEEFVVVDIPSRKKLVRSVKGLLGLEISDASVSNINVGLSLVDERGSKHLYIYDFGTDKFIKIDADPNPPRWGVWCREDGYCVFTADKHRQTYHGSNYIGPDLLVAKPTGEVHMYLAPGHGSVKFVQFSATIGRLALLVYEQNNARTNMQVWDIDAKQRVADLYTDRSCTGAGWNGCSDNACIAWRCSAVIAWRGTDGKWHTQSVGEEVHSGICIDVPDQPVSVCIWIDKGGTIKVARIHRDTGVVDTLAEYVGINNTGIKYIPGGAG